MVIGRQSGRIHERDRAIGVCCKSFRQIFYSGSGIEHALDVAGIIFKSDLQPLIWASHHQFVGKIVRRGIDIQMPFAVAQVCRGCATSTAGSSAMDARAETPAPPKTSIFDLPPKREKPAMTLDERLKLQKELMDARDRQAPGAKAKGGAARAQPVQP
jgi:hypothetical protein